MSRLLPQCALIFFGFVVIAGAMQPHPNAAVKQEQGQAILHFRKADGI
jgi:hypothetical protein